MFNKSTRITIEIPAKGVPTIYASLNDKVNPALVADFINRLLVREYLPYLYESLAKCPNEEYASRVIEGIDEVQSKLEIKPISNKLRNPMIKPSMVFSNAEGEE